MIHHNLLNFVMVAFLLSVVHTGLSIFFAWWREKMIHLLGTESRIAECSTWNISAKGTGQ